MRISLFVGAVLAVLAAPGAAAQSDSSARDVVQMAERAVAEDSETVVTGRWLQAIRRDSTDRVAALGLASLAGITYDFAAAERLFSGLLARSGGAAPDEWTVQAQLGLYRVALGEGDYRRADSLLTVAMAAARRIGDRGGEIDALIGFSNTRSATAGLDAGLAVLDSLRALLPPGDGWERVSYLCRLGLFRSVLSDSTATRLTADGIAMARRLGERRLEGHCLEAHATVHSLLGRRDSALATMDRAEVLLRATRDHASLARLASRRSDELQFLGRLGEAKASLQQVLAEAEISRNRERFAFAYGGLGSLAIRMKDLATAREYFEKAAALYDSLGHGAGARIARHNRALVFAAAGDLPAARSAFLAVVTEALGTGRLEDEVVARQELARVALRQGELAEVRRQIDAAERSARAHGRGEEARAHFGYDRGRLALARGDLAGAERLFTRYLAGIAPENHLHRHLTQVRLAEVATRRGDLARAEQRITAAGQELESWRASLGDDELRRFAFAATALGEHDPQVPVARVLAALAGAGRVDAAFALAEQRRARLLTDRLNQAEVLRTGAKQLALPAHRAEPLEAAAISEALPDSGSAILEYVAGSEGAPTTLFIITRSGSQVRVLPSVDTLVPAIRRLVALLESGGHPAALARTLGAALLDPAASALPATVTRLVVIPDGPLHRVPFDALRLADGRPAVERWAIGLAPSASLAASLWRKRAPVEPVASRTRILALGDPAFPAELASATSRGGETLRSAFAARGGLPRLEGSGDEARNVARYAGGGAEVRLRGDASEEWLKGAPLSRFRVIHLATHALVDESSLSRTALALAPSRAEDGFLSPADLAGLELDADMVVLSACRTAGGVTVAGEGVQGLTTPLLAAGARAVVATQWKVGDRSTVRLVADLYDGLARGRPVAEALREAKLAAIRRGAPPGEWAGFTVVGDPLARVPLLIPAGPGADLWLRIGGWLVLLGGVAAYWAVRRRGRRAERTSTPAEVAPTHH
jgi:CHAT domain-containing protein/tetratricopeptide (TPR) repeat protein